MNLQDLEIKVAGLDISNMVLTMTIYETLYGGIKGSFIVKDNINFYDTFIGHVQPSIEIRFKYLDVSCWQEFIGDGLTNMRVDKLGKEYVIHFISFAKVNLEVEKLSLVYSGPSHTILKAMWYETHGNHSPLYIDSSAVTKGRYVVPNVQAKVAISNVMNTAYDNENTAFCLYQRLWDRRGSSRLSSFDFMNKNYFYDKELIGTNYMGSLFTITNRMVGTTDEDDGLSVLATIGSSIDFKLEEFQKNFHKKMAAGFWGSKLSHVHLDETKHEDIPAAEISEIQTQTRFKLSNKLYDDNTKSIFSTVMDPAAVAAYNAKNRILQGQYLKVGNMVPIPYLGVGFCVAVNQGGSNISFSRQDNLYIISNINHKITLDDGEFNYTQDIGLIRE